MLKKLFNIIKSTFLLILLGGISVMPWLGYLDVPIMNEDFLVLSWYEPTAFWDAFRNFYERVVDGPYWRPVIWTVNSLTKFLAGYSAWPYHLTNILVYGIVVFAFFDFLKRIGFERRRAWLGAFIFAVLPSHELSVAWIAGRTDTIMAMFLLFGMNNLVYAYKNNRYYFLPAVFFFLFAMLSKEPAYAVPAVPFIFLLLRQSKVEKKDWLGALRHSLILTGIVFVVLLYRYIVIGGTPFESPNFANIDFLTMLRNIVIYIPVSFIRADQLESLYYFLINNTTAKIIASVIASGLLAAAVLRYRKMEKREKRLLLFGFLWFIIFILPASTFFGQWYAFTASFGLIIMLMSFIKLDFDKRRSRYAFYLILSAGIIVSVINSSRSDMWLIAAEKSDTAYRKIDYKSSGRDTLIFLGVPDKIDRINCMKIGFTQAIWFHLDNDSIEVSSPLRAEMSEESFVTLEKISDNEILMELINGRFLPVGGRSRAVIIDEKLHYEDGFQKFDIETHTKPIIISKAHITIKKKSLLDKVFLFDGKEFVAFDKLNEQLEHNSSKK
jgi:hypothetical protein